MTTEYTVGKLTATRRFDTGKGLARKLRGQGMIPGICYGLNEESIPLILNPQELRGSLDPGRRKNTLIDLSIQDGKNVINAKVMLKEVQIDSLKDHFLHADFIRVADDRPIEVAVPLELVGKPVGVKTGGTLHQVFRTLPVRCLPTKIPVSVSVDVSALDLNESVSVKDLAELGEDVEVLLPLNKTIALVMSPRKATEEETAAAAAAEAEGEAAAEGDKAKEGEKAEAGKAAETTKK